MNTYIRIISLRPPVQDDGKTEPKARGKRAAAGIVDDWVPEAIQRLNHSAAAAGAAMRSISNQINTFNNNIGQAAAFTRQDAEDLMNYAMQHSLETSFTTSEVIEQLINNLSRGNNNE